MLNKIIAILLVSVGLAHGATTTLVKDKTLQECDQEVHFTNPLNSYVGTVTDTNKTFIALDDTPSTYVGHAGQALAVNSGETALEYVTTTNAISVTNVVFDGDFIPVVSGTVDIATALLPVKAIYVDDASAGKQSVNYQTTVTMIEESTATKIFAMDDIAGTNTEWSEWSIGGTQDTDGNWRIGVISSNLTIQVRVSGVWTNAIVFTRP